MTARNPISKEAFKAIRYKHKKGVSVYALYKEYHISAARVKRIIENSDEIVADTIKNKELSIRRLEQSIFEDEFEIDNLSQKVWFDW